MAQALSGIADVNVFIAAFRTDHLSHERCAAWLDRQGTGSGQFGINSVVLSGAMRVLTNPRIFVDPASSSEAADFCQAIVDCPNAVVIEPGPKHWGIFMDLVLSTATSHRLIPDAWFAALAIEAECPWISLDQDFGLFPGLDWRQPYASRAPQTGLRCAHYAGLPKGTYPCISARPCSAPTIP